MLNRYLLALLVVFTAGCNLTVINEGGGIVTSVSGSIDCGEECSASYDTTATETLEATPDSGFTFVGWEGACTGTAACQVTIGQYTGNKKVTAKFARENDATVALGKDHYCAIMDGMPYCWGYSGGGATSVPPDHLADAKEIAAGLHLSCSLNIESAKCWGVGTDLTSYPELFNPHGLSSSHIHVCVLDDVGVKCWGGGNYHGENDVPPLTDPVEVAAGRLFTCALDSIGVQCWGSELHGITEIPELVNPRGLSAGGHACVLADNGPKCWGFNASGQTDVPALNSPSIIAAGSYHSCALDDDGVKCWGNNNYGQIDVPALQDPYQLFVGGDSSCALDSTGLVCWGGSSYGPIEVPEFLK